MRKLAKCSLGEQAQPTEKASSGGFGATLSWLLLLAVLLAIAAAYPIKIWRRIALSFAGPHRVPKVGYRLALDLLGEVGIAREEAETREAFSRRIAPQLPSVHLLTKMNSAALLRARPPNLDERAEFSAQTWHRELAQLRREIRASFPAWRRVAGLLNPFSFLSTR